LCSERHSGGALSLKLISTSIDAGSEKLLPTRSRLSILFFDGLSTTGGSHEFSTRIRMRDTTAKLISVFSSHRSRVPTKKDNIVLVVVLVTRQMEGREGEQRERERVHSATYVCHFQGINVQTSGKRVIRLSTNNLEPAA